MTVYFVSSRSGGRIKIGFTRGDVRARIASLQTGCPEPLVCLGTMPGDLRTEADVHGRFASQRSHGEWFNESPELLEFIRSETKPVELDNPTTPTRGRLYWGVLRNGITPTTGRYLRKNASGMLARLACVEGGEQWVRIETLRPLPDSEVVRQAVTEHNGMAQRWPWQ